MISNNTDFDGFLFIYFFAMSDLKETNKQIKKTEDISVLFQNAFFSSIFFITLLNNFSPGLTCLKKFSH